VLGWDVLADGDRDVAGQVDQAAAQAEGQQAVRTFEPLLQVLHRPLAAVVQQHAEVAHPQVGHRRGAAGLLPQRAVAAVGRDQQVDAAHGLAAAAVLHLQRQAAVGRRLDAAHLRSVADGGAGVLAAGAVEVGPADADAVAGGHLVQPQLVQQLAGHGAGAPLPPRQRDRAQPLGHGRQRPVQREHGVGADVQAVAGEGMVVGADLLEGEDLHAGQARQPGGDHAARHPHPRDRDAHARLLGGQLASGMPPTRGAAGMSVAKPAATPARKRSMQASASLAEGTRTVDLPVAPITTEAFAPYGTLLQPAEDGKLFGPDEAQLELTRGTPRFYVMRLKGREKAFAHITRHLAVTQCLASVGGKPWLLAVAPPLDPDNPQAEPDLDALRAFHVPGEAAVALHRSTWHAGPFFDGPTQDFFNLELADTNQADHHTCRLDSRFGLRFRFIA
jgi:ureidoglycolate lyase